MINTSDVTPTTKDEALSARSRGNMSEDQFSWLANQLGPGEAGPHLMFVAGHHPFDRFVSNQGNRLRDLVAGEPRVAAYITGHTHVNAITQHDRGNGLLPLWEIVGGSIPAYPQFAQIVELLENTNDEREFFLRVRTFRQQLSDRACPEATMTSDLACLAKRGREGARVDETSAWRTDAEAIQAANGMLRVRISN